VVLDSRFCCRPTRPAELAGRVQRPVSDRLVRSYVLRQVTETLNEEATMKRRTQIAIAGAAAALAVGAGTGAVAANDDDDATEAPITGAAKAQAEEAALAAAGGGTVSGTEVNDEESKYEVEVTRTDGSQVDVQLDENFEVVGQEDEDANDDG